MTERGEYPPQQGYAWRGDWHRRLYELIQKRGAASVTEFVESNPGVSLLDLAEDLGSGDVAAVQLQWRLVAEAETTGTMERCARSLLARELRHSLPGGWEREWVDVPGNPDTPFFRRAGAFAYVTGAMPERYVAAARRVCDALQAADLAAGWLPADADDPTLVGIFTRYWSGPNDPSPKGAR